MIKRVVANQLHSGFRPQWGTEAILVVLQDDLFRRLTGQMHPVGTPRSLRGFNTIDPSILSEVGTGGLTLSWLQSFLEDYVQRVQIREEVSAPWILQYGVPQGLALSPMLYNVHLKPLGEVIWRFGVRYHQ